MSAAALRVGTRGSRLALWQANTVASQLAAAGIASGIVIIRTTGDRSQTEPAAMPGPADVHKREFVKELEDALLTNTIDVAVHSAKDMPVDLPEGLAIAACLAREDPLDAIVLRDGEQPGTLTSILERLGHGGIVGTGSIRRTAQLAASMPGATFAPIRGNVDTRLGKLDAGGFDALVLASAGLRRLGFGGRISAAIPIDRCVPAPGQGIVAAEIRAGDEAARAALQKIHDDAAGRCLEAERALVTALGGGCQLPLGGIASLVDAGRALEMHAAVASPDGNTVVRRSATGAASNPAALGRELAAALEAEGARAILEAVRR